MENPKNETEILSADEQKLRELCGSLEKVEAPKDFDFKLKARIANSKPGNFQPRFGFAFRYTLPALALIFVLGILVYNGGFLSSKENQIAAGVSTETNPPPQNSAASNLTTPAPTEKPSDSMAVLPSNQGLPKAPENEIAEKTPKSREVKKKRELKNDNFSELKSVTPPLVVQLQNPQNNEKIVPMKVKEILLVNGINADFENGKWKVKSVVENGIGESSGVKENDIIEAIDDKPLVTETINSRTVSGKTLTVTRDGVKSQISLRSKQ